jgi:type 1 glutamine amidotransferase
MSAVCVGGMLMAGPAFAGTPKPEDLKKMEAALPAKAPATPKKARKVLIYGNAQGFVHSSIELGEETIAKLGEKTGAYTSVISNDPAVFDDLSGFDAIMMVSTTGRFMVPKTHYSNKPEAPKKATEDEKKAFEKANEAKIKEWEEKKKAEDERIAPYNQKERQRCENLIAFVKSGKGLAGIHAASDSYHDPDSMPIFPEWGEFIGGYFNGHPFQNVEVKIDDPKSPITAGFDGKTFNMVDETYTFKKEPWSREKLHILTSLDISGMKADPKNPQLKQGENRPYDHDYGISWIHTYGQGRVFYCAHGHKEEIYTKTPMLEEFLAGMQYVLGDLECDATPSNPKTAAAK